MSGLIPESFSANGGILGGPFPQVYAFAGESTHFLQGRSSGAKRAQLSVKGLDTLGEVIHLLLTKQNFNSSKNQYSKDEGLPRLYETAHK